MNLPNCGTGLSSFYKDNSGAWDLYSRQLRKKNEFKVVVGDRGWRGTSWKHESKPMRMDWNQSLLLLPLTPVVQVAHRIWGSFFAELTKHVHLAQKWENLKVDVGKCGAVTEQCAVSQNGDVPAISNNTCELQSSCHFTSALSISHKNLFCSLP